MLEVYALNINEVRNSEQLYDFVSIKRKNKTIMLHDEDDKLRSLLGEILIRSIIKEKFGYKNEEIYFYETIYGKPYISFIGDFYFNVSHSGNWVLCAISNKMVGIDIEKKTKLYTNINNFVLSDEEYKEWIINKNERNINIHKLWTVKESFSKAVGEGLNIQFNNINSKKIGESKYLIKYRGKKYFIRYYNIFRNYEISLCSVYYNLPSYIHIKNLDNCLYTLKYHNI